MARLRELSIQWLSSNQQMRIASGTVPAGKGAIRIADRQLQNSLRQLRVTVER
jgi:hypothetical protein